VLLTRDLILKAKDKNSTLKAADANTEDLNDP